MGHLGVGEGFCAAGRRGDVSRASQAAASRAPPAAPHGRQAAGSSEGHDKRKGKPKGAPKPKTIVQEVACLARKAQQALDSWQADLDEKGLPAGVEFRSAACKPLDFPPSHPAPGAQPCNAAPGVGELADGPGLGELAGGAARSRLRRHGAVPGSTSFQRHHRPTRGAWGKRALRRESFRAEARTTT
jgi:hypothetical protein